MVMNNTGLTEKFDRIRGMFPLLTRFTFLDSAAQPPLAVPIRKRLDDFYDTIEFSRFESTKELFAAIESVRGKLAKMFGCDPGEIGLISNTSYGINIAAWGLDLKEGQSILLPDIEFPANVYPYLKLRDNGINVKFFETRNRIIDLEDIEKNLTDDVRLLSISWVQFMNGARNDLDAIGRICSERGVFLCVDGIQGAGNIPLDFSRTKVDLFSAGAEKWLLTPWGIGFCYLAARSDHLIKDYYCGWLGVDWGSEFSSLIDFSKPFKKGAARFETGTYPYQKIAAFDTALDILMEVGVDNIFAHNKLLLDRLIAYINDSDYYKLQSPLEDSKRSSIISFTCDNLKELGRVLADRRILVSVREGGIRVAVHLYNNMDDIECLIEALDQFRPKRS